jgi:hypothetical protein
MNNSNADDLISCIEWTFFNSFGFNTKNTLKINKENMSEIVISGRLFDFYFEIKTSILNLFPSKDVIQHIFLKILLACGKKPILSEFDIYREFFSNPTYDNLNYFIGNRTVFRNKNVKLKIPLIQVDMKAVEKFLRLEEKNLELFPKFDLEQTFGIFINSPEKILQNRKINFHIFPSVQELEYYIKYFDEETSSIVTDKLHLFYYDEFHFDDRQNTIKRALRNYAYLIEYQSIINKPHAFLDVKFIEVLEKFDFIREKISYKIKGFPLSDDPDNYVENIEEKMNVILKTYMYSIDKFFLRFHRIDSQNAKGLLLFKDIEYKIQFLYIETLQENFEFYNQNGIFKMDNFKTIHTQDQFHLIEESIKDIVTDFEFKLLEKLKMKEDWS